MTRPPTLETAPAWGRSDVLALSLVLLSALALRLWLASTHAGLTMDSPLYVRMGEDLLAGRHGPSPAHHGYPLLVALASLVVPGRELPGRAVSLLGSLAVVGLVWVLARRRTTLRRALLPAGIVALHPLLAANASAIMTEPCFLALALAGVALLDAGRARAGGALLGAAWWVRPEAAVVAPLAALLSPLRWRERGVALLLAACVALPYTIVLRVEQGYWSLTPKSVLVRAPHASVRSAEWRLADSTAFADRATLSERLARDGGAILRAYPGRLAEQGRVVLEAWPWPLLLLTLLGVFHAAGRGPWLAFASLVFVYPLLAAPPDVRFAQLVLPALALPVAASFGARAWPPRLRGFVLIAPLLGLYFLWTGRMAERALAFDDGPMLAMRGAGAWLARNSPPDAMVMDRKSYVAFFASRPHVQLPDEPLDVLLAHARKTGARYLVVEEYVVRALRPQLAPLLDTERMRGEPRVRLVFAARPAPGEGVAVFEVVP